MVATLVTLGEAIANFLNLEPTVEESQGIVTLFVPNPFLNGVKKPDVDRMMEEASEEVPSVLSIITKTLGNLWENFIWGMTQKTVTQMFKTKSDNSLPQIFMEVPYPGSYRLLLPTVHTNTIFCSTIHIQFTNTIFQEVAHRSRF